MLASAIYTGEVAHTRLAPRRREFSYPVYMLYLDLGELDDVFDGSRLFGARGRRAPAQFSRADFYGDPDRPLDEEIRSLVQRRTGVRPGGAVRVLATPRTFGYQFNPIAVYYCFDSAGDLSHVVADVTNIPWRESCAYVFAAHDQKVNATARKRMHVSPFLGMDYVYRLATCAPGDELRLFVSNSRAGDVEFVATLKLRRAEATAANLRRTLLRFPAMTLLVTARIFWQAARMRLGGFAWHRRTEQLPEPVEIETEEYTRDAAIF